MSTQTNENGIGHGKLQPMVRRSDLFEMLRTENKTDYDKAYNDAILDVANRIPNRGIDGNFQYITK